jgi:glycosyltransferase involved in cell wall biosynthesis
MSKNYFPKVSIITPVKNSEKTIGNTILSILNQSYKNIEHIVVHGKSLDKTSSILKEYSSNNKIILIEEEDNSIAEAMNKGLKKSTGDLVSILNAGDTYYSKSVEIMVNHHQKNQNDILHADLKVFSKNYSYVSKGAIKPNFLNGMEINHITMFVPSAYYKKFGYYDESFVVCGDLDFCIKMQKNNINFLKINSTIGNYEIGGISTTRPKIIIDEKHKIRKKYNLYEFLDLEYIKDLFLYIFFKNKLVQLSHFKRYLTYKFKNKN